MKKLSLICLCMLCGTIAFSQNAFQDAKTIVRIKKELSFKKDESGTKVDTITAILKKYVQGDKDAKTVESLKDRYKFSTYITNLITDNAEKEKKVSIPYIRDHINAKGLNLSKEDVIKVDKIKKLFKELDLLKSKEILSFRKVKDSIDLSSDSAQISARYSDIVNEAYSKLKKAYKLPDSIGGLRKIKDTLVYLMPKINSSIESYNYEITKSFTSSKALMDQATTNIDLRYDQDKETFNISAKLETEQQTGLAATQQKAAASMALPSQSEIIDAMAIYLVNRVKSEASLAFIDLVRNKLKSDTILLDLFPKTRELISNFSSYESPNFGQSWRHAFAADLITIPDKLATDKNLERYAEQTLGGSNTQYYRFFKMAVQLATMSRDNTNFIDIIEYMAQDLNNSDDYFLSNYIRFLNMINNEFYVKGSNTYWINYVQFNQLNAEEFQILAALLKQKYENGIFKVIPLRLDDTGTANSISINDFRAWMSRIFFVINQYQVALQNNSANFKDKIHDVSSYWTFIGDSFKRFTSMENNRFILQKDAASPFAKQNDKYLGYINTINTTFQELTGLYGAIEDKNYPHVLESVLELIKGLEKPQSRQRRIFVKYFIDKQHLTEREMRVWFQEPNNQEFFSSVQRFQNDYEKQMVADTLTADSNRMITVARKFKGIPGYQNFFRKGFIENNSNHIADFTKNYNARLQNYYDTRYSGFIKTTNFINDVMVTGNSDDLSKVIASYASPPQSYRIKRNSRFSIDLNAYVGLTAGFESFEHPKIAYGLTAPIGVAFSWGYADKEAGQPYIKKDGQVTYLKGNSFSVALTIIDIGAVVRYRFSNDSAEGLPKEVNFSQFLSPSVQLHWGIKNTPLDFVVAYQYLPNLRKLGDPDVPAAPKTFRSLSAIYAGLVFDLPLMNFKH
ncbi:hypothetical protein EWM62_06180 [Mucilaginibacter terrigena]|uniref:Uncharacterized protein n=1 Tax=Mucilaginibacter terrigena TaxID=2492395 RepID=A0A4Q5LQ33_9SPHI|nr:hypothetical protein [Mucilaginibacter terrigena]RYU91524.1 hypothetical protein EWM62_06180 [Mucilaginibacter terrigena]